MGHATYRDTPIPGTTVSMTFIEFKDIDRRPLNPRVQDPGTAILQLLVRDMDSVLRTVKANGGTVVHGVRPEY